MTIAAEVSDDDRSARSPVRRQARSALRRRAILDAALACFDAAGVEATAIEDICARSRSSVGSLYHLFGTKHGVAAAVYLDALADFQSTVAGALAPGLGVAAGLRAFIAAHVVWVDAHPRHARFLHEHRHADALADAADALRAMNATFGGAIAQWARPLMQRGALRRLPVDLFIAVLAGPTHEYVRGLLAGRAATPPAAAIDELVDCALRALATDPNPDARKERR